MSGQPKTMSSRLLTMKFMQRSAFSPRNNSSPSTPSTPQQHDPSAPPSAKRQKFSNNSSAPSTPDPHSSSGADRLAVSAALAEVERLRANARARNALAIGGETEWVLHIPNQWHVNGSGDSGGVVHAASVNAEESDSEDQDTDPADSIWKNTPTGRLSYGNFKRRKSAPTKSTSDKDRSKSADPDNNDYDSDNDSDSSSSLDHQGSTTTKRPDHSVGKSSKSKKRERDVESEGRAMDKVDLKKMFGGSQGISGFKPKAGSGPRKKR